MRALLLKTMTYDRGGGGGVDVYKTLRDFDRRENGEKIDKSNLEVVPVK